MKQLIFVVESDNKAKTDARYISKLISFRYDLSDNDTKIFFIYMGGKNKYRNNTIRKQILSRKSENNKGENYVLYCFDTDKIDTNQNDLKDFEAEKEFCKNNNDYFIWFNDDIEFVLLETHVESSRKQQAAQKFYRGDSIKIKESNLMSKNENCKGKSNICLVLDTILPKKK